eukprot:76920-Lingulodinium_polyedra.AAC.1
MEHRFNNEGKMERILPVDAQGDLQHNVAEKKSKIRRNSRSTADTRTQLVDRWQDIVRGRAPVDSDGVVAGRAGFKRYEAEAGEQEFSDSAEEDERAR